MHGAVHGAVHGTAHVTAHVTGTEDCQLPMSGCMALHFRSRCVALQDDREGRWQGRVGFEGRTFDICLSGTGGACLCVPLLVSRPGEVLAGGFGGWSLSCVPACFGSVTFRCGWKVQGRSVCRGLLAKEHLQVMYEGLSQFVLSSVVDWRRLQLWWKECCAFLQGRALTQWCRRG